MKKLCAFLFLISFFIGACGGGGGGIAPTAPTGVAVAIGDASGELVISWENVADATSYNLYWGTSAGVTKDTGTKVEDVTSSHSLTSLTNGTRHYFVVTAVNSSGESDISAEASDIPQIDPVGSMDDSFNSTGFVKYEDASVSVSTGTGVAVDADGNILVLGTVFRATTGYDIAVWRFKNDGTPDTAFNGTGLVLIHNAAGGDNWDMASHGISVDQEGRIVLAGYSDNLAAKSEVVVVRLMPDGSYDDTFGTSGIARFCRGVDGNDMAYDMVLDPDGRIVVAGLSTSAGNDSMLLRFNSDGSLDTNFGTAGAVFESSVPVYGTNIQATGVEVDAEGRPVVIGYVTNQALVLWRYSSSGVLDPTFSDDGVVTYSEGSMARGTGLTLDASGRIVATGFVIGAMHQELIALRYDTNGALDTTFGTDGVMKLSRDFANFGIDVTMDARQKILVVGTSGMSSGTAMELILLRLDANGVPDPTFGTNGVITYHNADVADSEDMGNAIITDQEGRILMTGQTNPYDTRAMMTWRFK